MTRTIPTSLSLLTLSAFASGCSDAHKLASAYEKVCDAQCECPEAMDFWNDVKNCKDACRGDAIIFQALIEDAVEAEPCGNFDNIIADIKRCAKNSCGPSRDECLGQAYYDVYECWPELVTSEYYYQQPDGPITASELIEQLSYPIPDTLAPATLHSATN
jgi:hypothetical protein